MGGFGGHLPKPTPLRILEGDRSHGKSKYNKKDEYRPPADKIRCPSWLTSEARKQWRRLAPVLKAAGVLTNADVDAFAAYCQAYAHWREADQAVCENGVSVVSASGTKKPNPDVGAAMQYLKMANDLGSHFGLTPVSRTRLFANLDIKQPDSDPMESLLGSYAV